MRKYSTEFKLEVVQSFLAGDGGRRPSAKPKQPRVLGMLCPLDGRAYDSTSEGCQLVSVGLVGYDERFQWYAERDPLPFSAPDFVHQVVYPLLERGVYAMRGSHAEEQRPQQGRTARPGPLARTAALPRRRRSPHRQQPNRKRNSPDHAGRQELAVHRSDPRRRARRRDPESDRHRQSQRPVPARLAERCPRPTAHHAPPRH